MADVEVHLWTSGGHELVIDVPEESIDDLQELVHGAWDSEEPVTGYTGVGDLQVSLAAVVAMQILAPDEPADDA